MSPKKGKGSISMPKAILLLESTHQGLIEKDPTGEKFFRLPNHLFSPLF